MIYTISLASLLTLLLRNTNVTGCAVPSYMRTQPWPSSPREIYEDYEGPNNTVATRGSRVRLTCRAIRQMSGTWTHGDTFRVFDETGINHTLTRHSVRPVDRSLDLVIDPVLLDDAGIYTCSFTPWVNYTRTLPTAELVIFESDPICTSNISGKLAGGEIIQAECTLTYCGNWKPEVLWQLMDAEGNATTMDGQLSYYFIGNTNRNTTINSTVFLEMTANLSMSHISCTVYFSRSMSPSSLSATNVPDYIYTWKSPTMLMLYEEAWPAETVVLLTVVLSVCGLLMGVALLCVAVVFCRKKCGKNASESVDASTNQTEDERKQSTFQSSSGCSSPDSAVGKNASTYEQLQLQMDNLESPSLYTRLTVPADNEPAEKSPARHRR